MGRTLNQVRGRVRIGIGLGLGLGLGLGIVLGLGLGLRLGRLGEGLGWRVWVKVRARVSGCQGVRVSGC